MDIGTWEMKLTNTENDDYMFYGPICDDLYVDGNDLSDMVREVLKIDDLYVFDGNDKPDEINKITIDYKKTTNNSSYSENLIIDRFSNTIEMIQTKENGNKSSHKFEMKDEVEEFLESFNANYLFYYIEGNPDDVVDSLEAKTYEITLDLKRRGCLIIDGSFDKFGLPWDFSNFAEKLVSLIGNGFEMLNPIIYNKAKRRRGEYIFLSVSFSKDSRTYYYLTDDDSIKEGDYVLVPVGIDNNESLAQVKKIEYFSEDKAPMRVEKIKKIIKTCRKTPYFSYGDIRHKCC